MSAGPFTPAEFAVPVVAPNATTLTRRIPYLGPSEFKGAPTAIAVNNLVPGGNAAANMAELYNVLLRASDWVDLICFHGPDGTLAASPTVQSGWVTPLQGELRLICNFKPILEVIGMALGRGPNDLVDIGDAAAQTLSIESSIITLHQPVPRRTYAAWSYVAGYPHMTLAEDCDEGATSVVVAASVPGQIEPYGVYPGTQLTIRDPAGGVEVVVVDSIDGAALNLGGALQFDHDVPSYPDFVYVTALPHAVEQACISLASCLIKQRGTRAAQMASQPGGATSKGALAQAGALEDYELAIDNLHPFISVYRAG